MTALRLARLHRVALLVDLRVEGGWPAALAALVLAVADPVGWLGDGRGDVAPAQVSPVGGRAVGLISQYAIRAGAGAARPQKGNSDGLQHCLELRAVTALPGGDHDGQRLLALLTRQVDFGGPAAAGAAQAMIGGLLTG